ncbi:hypothetical protein QM646_00840 [Rhodococcus erythropolis]|nr:hypothetical protein [Rhodococcus erythropolis]
MKNMLIVAAVGVLASVSLAACGGDQPDSSTTTSAASPSVSAAAPTTTAIQLPSSVPAAEPITFVCGDPSTYQFGTALYSDGTTGYEGSCDTYVPAAPAPVSTKVLQFCDYPGTAVYTDGSYSTTDPACDQMRAEANANQNPGGGYPYDPEEDRNGDGVVNGYERCGVRCGKEPTSGDIQTQHGCEQGYITGVACEPYIG